MKEWDLNMTTLQVGKQAPDFTLLSNEGQEVTLSDYRGKYVVLYFYPKDMTPGCTTQACDFRDRANEFADLDAVIIGVSPDPVAGIRNLSTNISCRSFCCPTPSMK